MVWVMRNERRLKAKISYPAKKFTCEEKLGMGEKIAQDACFYVFRAGISVAGEGGTAMARRKWRVRKG